MKNHAFALLVTLSLTAHAQVPSLAFPDTKIDVPPLSLGESMKTASPPAFPNETRPWLRSHNPTQPGSPKLISRMPILEPRADIDSKMVKAPDPSVAYKMIVKKPDIVAPK